MSKKLKTKGGVNERRKRALGRLERDLPVKKASLIKITNDLAKYKSDDPKLKVVLQLYADVDKSIPRIEREIATLKSRII